MEKEIKLNLLAFFISLSLHALLFSMPFFSKAFSTKTYQIVDVLSISFDTATDASLVGVRSIKGEKKVLSKRAATLFPSGRISRKLKNIKGSGREASRIGKFRSSNKESKMAFASAEKFLSAKKGNNKLTLSWSVSVPDGKYGKRLPSVSAQKIVPYLLKVRDKIMSNWNNPYINKLNPGEKKVVIYVTINKKGKLDEIKIERLSSDTIFNRSAIMAIYSSEPFDPIPTSVNIDKVKVKVNFEVK